MYDNKTIIISCAGMGKRLGREMPKPLVEVDGKPLIIRQLEMLKECKDIRIVVGYKANDVIELVNKYRKDITFVFNHDYMNNGRAASVSLAAKYANEYIITIDGDLLIHPQDMEKILNQDGEFIGVCKASTDNPVLTIIENDKVVGFSREEGQYEWTGVAQFKSKNLNETTGHVYQMLEPSLPTNYLFLRTKEIDTPNDFVNAERWVKNNFSDNITIGVVGGMGSVATVDFFNRLVSSFKAEKEWERPRIIIDNRCSMPSRVRAILYNERVEELINSLTESISFMIDNYCDYVVLACNTSHVFLPKIMNNNKKFEGKILNIIELLAKKMSQEKVSAVKLLASEGTILSGIYKNELEKYNITIAELKEEDYKKFRDWIEAVKQQNITQEIKDDFIKYVNSSEYDNIILGCTELPILYNLCKDYINKKIYDPLDTVIEFLNQEQNKRV